MAANILVLGAGASAHYDFPVAYGIVQRIRQGTDHFENICAQYGVEPRTYTQFVSRLLASGCTSIDQFAEYLDDPDDIRIAKTLIAFFLGMFEVPSALTAHQPIGHWYELLANHLIGRTLDTFPTRDIGIITFNYERSLEQYLLGCLTSRFEGRHTPAEIRAAFLRLPIVHIYGRMGQLPGFGTTAEPERPYEQILNVKDMVRAITGMHLLRELRTDPGRGDREAARALLRGASATGNLTFLGFAFAPENLEALDFANTYKREEVYSTMFNIGGDDERYGEVLLRLNTVGHRLVGSWRTDVYTAVLTHATTILGPPRLGA